MISYPIVVFPFVCLAIGFLIYFISNQLKSTWIKPVITTVILVSVCFASFDIDSLYHNHIKNRKNDKENLVGAFKELKMIESLDSFLNKEKYVLFNNSITPYGHIATMFHTDYESYAFTPSKEQLELLKSKGCKIACLETENLPIHIVNDKSIILIPIPEKENKKSH